MFLGMNNRSSLCRVVLEPASKLEPFCPFFLLAEESSCMNNCSSLQSLEAAGGWGPGRACPPLLQLRDSTWQHTLGESGIGRDISILFWLARGISVRLKRTSGFWVVVEAITPHRRPAKYLGTHTHTQGSIKGAPVPSSWVPTLSATPIQGKKKTRNMLATLTGSGGVPALIPCILQCIVHDSFQLVEFFPTMSPVCSISLLRP